MSFYAVAIGRKPGVFVNWIDCEQQVKGFSGALYKKFKTEQEAKQFIKQHINEMKTKKVKLENNEQTNDIQREQFSNRQFEDVYQLSIKRKIPSENTFYAVAIGRCPGIYLNWQKCKMQVENLFSAKYEKFSTQQEAESFINQFKQFSKQINRNLNDPDPKLSDTLVAFCDGSAFNNGTKQCRDGFACIFPHNRAWDIGQKITQKFKTNNRAEYMAAMEAMKRANIQNPQQNSVLYIYSDSMLLIKSMTEWIHTWKKNNWVTSEGNQVKNIDLLEKLIELQGKRRIIWKHIKAHTNKNDWLSINNQKADDLAKRMANS